jgi:hypothetical protein
MYPYPRIASKRVSAKLQSLHQLKWSDLISPSWALAHASTRLTRYIALRLSRF